MKTPFNLEEAVTRAEGPGFFAQLKEQAPKHPIIARAVREGIYPDAIGALGGMQKVVYNALYPKLVSRKLLSIVNTQNNAETFYKVKSGYVLTNQGTVMAVGPKPNTPVTINADRTNTAKQEWNQNVQEDVPWDIMGIESQDMIADLAKQENADVVTLFNAIANGDLAGGAEVTITDGAPTWAEIIAGLKKFGDDYPDVVALNNEEFLGLFNIEQFISKLYSSGDPQPGTYIAYHPILNITFLGCSQVTKTLFVNSKRAGALILRSDILTVPWRKESEFLYGISSRERYGMGILHSNAVGRGTH